MNGNQENVHNIYSSLEQIDELNKTIVVIHTFEDEYDFISDSDFGMKEKYNLKGFSNGTDE